MLSGEELDITRDIQTAMDATKTDDTDHSGAAFLNYLANDFKREAIMTLGYLDTIWVKYEDEGSCADTPNCRRIKLGDGPLPNEHRTHRHGKYDLRVETRSQKGVAYIEFTAPNIGDIWEDVKGCAIGSAVLAVIAAILAGDFNTARTLFYPTFYACLVQKIGDRAKEVDVNFTKDVEYSCWKYHC